MPNIRRLSISNLTNLPSVSGGPRGNQNDASATAPITINLRYFFLCWTVIGIFIVLAVAFLLFQIMVNQYYEELYKVLRTSSILFKLSFDFQ